VTSIALLHARKDAAGPVDAVRRKELRDQLEPAGDERLIGGKETRDIVRGRLVDGDSIPTYSPGQ
jgi:hypothetical protein